MNNRRHQLAYAAAAMVTLAVGHVCAEPIAVLRIEQYGGDKLPEEQFRYQLQQKEGAEFDPQQAAEDVKRLYSTGLVGSVSHTVSRDASGGLVLTYRIRVKPVVAKVAFEGNQKFSDRQLMTDLTVFAGEPLNDARLTESANAIRKFYNDKGYYQATVQPVVETDPDGKILVTFKINERLREKLESVSFENNTAYPSLRLKYSIANQPWPLINRLFEIGLLNESELEADKARLRALYWEKGYLDFKVSDVIIEQDEDDPEYVRLNFVLDEGEPYTVTGCGVSGNTAFDAEVLMPLVTLEPDETFNSLKEEASAKNIRDFYGTFGYADVSVRPLHRTDVDNHTVEVIFDVYEGRKYAIEQIDITGNKITQERVIRRELAVLEGDPLDTTRVEASRQRLLGMGYFTRVDATTQAGTAPDTRRVVFDVEEKDPYTFRIGGGWSDSDSLAGMLEFSNNNFDITNPSQLFRGGGQRFRIQSIVGLERYNFNVDFTEPWLFDIPLRLDVSGYGNYVEYEHWNEERLGAKASLTKRIFENIDPFNSVSVGYKFEYVVVRGFSHHASEYLRHQGAHDLVSQVNFMLNRDTRDNLLEPTSGYQTSVFAAFAPSGLGSTESFYRLEGRGSIYHSFFDKAIVWMAGGHIGVVDSFNTHDVPIYERYFLGGGESLRGFPYRSVSPTDSNGWNIGGNSMLLLTTEVTHPIIGFIRGAIFCDAGGVWGKAYNYDLGRINVGIGYGLRIKVPVLNAPIKLDLAYPIVNRERKVKNTLRFHFNVGFTW